MARFPFGIPNSWYLLAYSDELAPGAVLPLRALDRDLVALQSRIPVDRKLQLVEAKLDQQEDPRDAEKRLRSKTTGLVALNVMLPCLALLVLGLSVFGWRRGEKRRFLQSTGN